MPNQIHLHLPSPCHENWDAMTPRDQGRHCVSCQKTVVDFTAMSDAEVLAFFENRPEQTSTCGRLRGDQLSTPPPPYRASRHLRTWMTLAAAVSLPLLGFSQTNPPVPPAEQKLHANASQDSLRLMQDREGFVRGRLVDSEGVPLIGATIIVTQTNVGTSSDIKGYFRLRLPKDARSITVDYIGYATRVLPVDTHTAGRNTNTYTPIVLQDFDTQIMYLGGITTPKSNKRKRKKS